MLQNTLRKNLKCKETKSKENEVLEKLRHINYALTFFSENKKLDQEIIVIREVNKEALLTKFVMQIID